jgi:hypothetical protein
MYAVTKIQAEQSSVAQTEWTSIPDTQKLALIVLGADV